MAGSEPPPAVRAAGAGHGDNLSGGNQARSTRGRSEASHGAQQGELFVTRMLLHWQRKGVGSGLEATTIN